MTSRNSTAKSSSDKPSKPYPEFPLFPHATGRWAKKIRGKLHYFGPWSDADGALAKYLEQKDALHAGRTPIDTREGVTVNVICRKFLIFKKARRDSGHLSAHLFDEYSAVTQRMVAAFGKSRLASDVGPQDFAKLRKAMEAKWGVYRIANEIIRIRGVFKFAADDGLIVRVPVYGQAFRPPSKKDIRLHRAAVGSRLLSPAEVRKMIDGAGQPLAVMVLLGINGALSNSDLASLPAEAIDLDGGWLDFARVKTGIPRRIPLWPETVAALRQWLAIRPKPKREDDASLVFITRYGDDWKAGAKGSPISKEIRKLLDELKIEGAKGFYSLRRTFQNVGEETRDFLATRAIMGHATNDVSEFYREQIGDERLKAVTDHIRKWAGIDAAGAARKIG